MITCPVCGNEISPGTAVCPFCESRIGHQVSAGTRKKARPGGIRILNIKDGMPTVEHALDRLRNGILTAQKGREHVLKIIHGYGSGGAGGAIRDMVRHELERMRASRTIRQYYPGERFSRNDNAIRHEIAAVPALGNDRDLDRANPGITVIFI